MGLVYKFSIPVIPLNFLFAETISNRHSQWILESEGTGSPDT